MKSLFAILFSGLILTGCATTHPQVSDFILNDETPILITAAQLSEDSKGHQARIEIFNTSGKTIAGVIYVIGVKDSEGNSVLRMQDGQVAEALLISAPGRVSSGKSRATNWPNITNNKSASCMLINSAIIHYTDGIKTQVNDDQMEKLFSKDFDGNDSYCSI